MPITVSIIDDHPMVVDGLSSMLLSSEHIVVISTYHIGGTLLDGLSEMQPDVLLLDILLPDKNGDELAKIISKSYPQVRMIAITSLDAPTHIKMMMRKGCKGYILKNTDKESLIKAIETVFNGEEYIEPSLKEKMLSNMLKAKKKQEGTHIPVPVLTRREKEILKLIVQDRSNQEIAEQLFLSIRTVEYHRFNLLQKLDVKSTIGLLTVALQMGLIEL